MGSVSPGFAFRSDQLLAVSSLTLLVLAAFIRTPSFEFFQGPSLWAEDGNIFYNQASNLGMHSILQPYSGYLHVYSRIWAYLSTFLDPAYIPLFFSSAWAIAFLIAAYFIFRAFSQLGYRLTTPTIIILMIYVQPNSGESYFNLTNSHSLVALALIVILATSPWDRFRWPTKTFVAIASLSGPFSIIVAPFVIIRILLEKDFLRNSALYTLFFVGATIQAFLFATSGRIQTTETANIASWLAPIGAYLSFGQTGALAIIAFTTWILVYIALFANPERQRRHVSTATFFLTTAAAIFAAGLLSEGGHASTITPMGDAARYFHIPYSLTFIAIALLISNGTKKLIATLGFSLFLLVQVAHHNDPLLHRKDLNYQSYVWLSRHVGTTYIPINPQWPTYPGWHIDLNPGSHPTPGLPRIRTRQPAIKPSQIKVIEPGPARRNIDDTSTLLEVAAACLDERFIGIELSVTSNHDGWLHIAPANQETAPPTAPIQKRFYPVGTTPIHISLNREEGTFLSFSVGNGHPSHTTMTFSRMYCGS